MKLLILLMPIILFAQHQITITIEVESFEEAAKVEKIVNEALQDYKPKVNIHTQKRANAQWFNNGKNQILGSPRSFRTAEVIDNTLIFRPNGEIVIDENPIYRSTR
jgi:type III secretory pathway component EscR